MLLVQHMNEDCPEPDTCHDPDLVGEQFNADRRSDYRPNLDPTIDVISLEQLTLTSHHHGILFVVAPTTFQR